MIVESIGILKHYYSDALTVFPWQTYLVRMIFINRRGGMELGNYGDRIPWSEEIYINPTPKALSVIELYIYGHGLGFWSKPKFIFLMIAIDLI